MISKKILLLSGAGIAAVSIAIAISINVVVNKSAIAPTTELTCQQLQAAIDRQDRSALSDLSSFLRSNLDRISATDLTCHLEGDRWTLDRGKIKTQKTEQVPTEGFTDPITMPLR